jgi:alpha-beta hydrolase superfamily lysophospholipase
VTAFRVRTVIPIVPIDKLRNNRRIREISCPLLVMHGENDTIIPFWHGQNLYTLATVPKRCWRVPGANHNDILMTNEPGYWAHITQFRDWIARQDDSKPQKETSTTSPINLHEFGIEGSEALCTKPE